MTDAEDYNDDEYDDDDDDDDEVDGNRIPAANATAVLDYLARSLVEDPDSVQIDVEERRSGAVSIKVHVSPGDMGRVIGKRGRVAHAIRTVVRGGSGAVNGVDADVDFVD